MKQQKLKVENNKINKKGKDTISFNFDEKKEIWKNKNDFKKSKWSKKEWKKSLIHTIHWKKSVNYRKIKMNKN